MKHAGTRFIFLAILPLLFLTGCYTPITKLDNYLPKKELVKFPTVDAVLQSYFTERAYQAIKDIPTVEGVTPTAYAAGTSRWSSIVSWISGSGTGRKIVFSPENLSLDGCAGLVHEYVHQLDDMSRDNPESYQWINIEVFLQAYEMLSNDSKYESIKPWCDGLSDYWITDIFGIGYGSEQIAYIAMFLTRKNKKTGKLEEAPEYLKAVFGKVLNIEYQETSAYITTTGEEYLVTASPDKIEMVRLK